MRNLAIVGAGPVGALLAHVVKERSSLLKQEVQCTLVEKSRGVGGRMTTNRAVGAAAGSRADVGAQYLTEQSKRWSSVYDRLVSRDLLVPLPPGSFLGLRENRSRNQNYAAPGGLSSIVRHFVKESGANLMLGKTVTSLELTTADVDVPASKGSSAAAAATTTTTTSNSNSSSSASNSDSPSDAADEEGATQTTQTKKVRDSSSPALPSPDSLERGGTVDSRSDAAATAADATASKTPASSSASTPASVSKWLVKYQDGSSSLHDAVVLTMPVPQILALTGDLPAILEGCGVLPHLRLVRYSSRYALILYFDKGAAETVRDVLKGTAGRFVNPDESDAIRWVSFDSYKRSGALATSTATASGQSAPHMALSSSSSSSSSSASAPPPSSATTVNPYTASMSTPPDEPCISLTIHTSISFGELYVDSDKELVEPVILDHFKRLFPTLPPPIESKVHKWRYSQVTAAYKGPRPFDVEDLAAPTASTTTSTAGEEKKGLSATLEAISSAGAVLLLDDPPLLLAGDAFSESNFEGCLTSADKALSLLASTRCFAAAT